MHQWNCELQNCCRVISSVLFNNIQSIHFWFTVSIGWRELLLLNAERNIIDNEEGFFFNFCIQRSMGHSFQMVFTFHGHGKHLVWVQLRQIVVVLNDKPQLGSSTLLPVVDEIDVCLSVSVTPAWLNVRPRFRGKWPVVVPLGHHTGTLWSLNGI